jgi:hypothetical protein
MGTSLTTFEDRPALSPHHAKFFEENKNIQDKQTVPSLSFEGKNWHIALNGEKTTIQKKDADGDVVAVTTLKVVILDQNPVRGRAYYGNKAYDPKQAAMPECWSDDNVTPSKFVKTPVAPNCAGCPMSEKGSRKSDNGKETKACSEHQFIAVVPAFNLDHEPLRMKLPITSIWDGQNKANDEAGWFAFKNYTDFLRAHQVDHTAMLVTKMKFDSAVGITYPKVLFARDRFLSDEEIDKLVPVIQSEKVKALISTSWTPNGVDGVRHGQISGPADDKAAAAAKDVSSPTGPTAEEIAAQQAAAAAEAAAKAAQEKAEKKAAKLAAAEAAKAELAARLAEAADDDDEGEIIQPGTAAAAPTQAASGAKAGAPKEPATPAASSAAGKPAMAAAATGKPPAGLGALLSKWGDD